MLKKVFVAGVFDCFHLGHQFFLCKAFSLHKNLTIVVARDTTVFKLKKKYPQYSEKKRQQKIQNIFTNYKNVKIRLGRANGNFFETIAEEKPNIIFLGYDQRFNQKKCKKLFPKIKIIRTKPFYPEYFKSSVLQKLLQ